VQQVLPKLKEINALPSRLLVENVAGFEVPRSLLGLCKTLI